MATGSQVYPIQSGTRRMLSRAAQFLLPSIRVESAESCNLTTSTNTKNNFF